MFQCELKYDNVEQMDCQMIEEEKCESKYETIYDTKCDTIYEPKVRTEIVLVDFGNLFVKIKSGDNISSLKVSLKVNWT